MANEESPPLPLSQAMAQEQHCSLRRRLWPDNGPSDEEIEAMLADQDAQRYQNESLYGAGFDHPPGPSPSTPIGAVPALPEEWFTPHGSRAAPPPPEFVSDDQSFLSYIAHLQNDAPDGPAHLGNGRGSGSASSDQPFVDFEVPEALPVPRVLRRASGKRPVTAEELAEQKARADFAKTMENTIAVGPFMEGLMSYGKKLPKEIYNAVRLRWCNTWKLKHPELLGLKAGVEIIAMARKSFAQECTWAQKVQIMKDIRSESLGCPEKQGFVRSLEAAIAVIEARTKKVDPEVEKGVRARGHVLLFVYNHDAFLIRELQQDAKNLLSMEDLVQLVRGHPPYLRMQEAFISFCFAKASELHCEMACSLEISPEKYASTGNVRVHLNLALGRKGDRLAFRAPYLNLAFARVLPVYAPKLGEVQEAAQLKRSGFSKMWGQAAYYLQFPKIGMLCNSGTKLPFRDYPVAQNAIMAYLQARVRNFHMCPSISLLMA